MGNPYHDGEEVCHIQDSSCSWRWDLADVDVAGKLQEGGGSNGSAHLNDWRTKGLERREGLERGFDGCFENGSL